MSNITVVSRFLKIYSFDLYSTSDVNIWIDYHKEHTRKTLIGREANIYNMAYS
jgi:hypothetical protein